ncbi:MAG: NUDIX domain-containing protein [Candidatus Saccharibacteria bacterium]|nr:NUDIX domain-containing protein [Candidatus Saccharibacteria bacterium]
MADLCDEVDENDSLTGRQVTVDQAHEQKLIHRCVAIFVFDKDGKLYVQVHKNSGGRLDHTVGGHVDAGENYDQAAYRETSEEIGITDMALNKLTDGLYSDEGSRIHVFAIYEFLAPEGWKFVPNDEVEELLLMNVTDVVEMMNTLGTQKFTGGFMSTMRKYLEIKNSKMKVN